MSMSTCSSTPSSVCGDLFDAEPHYSLPSLAEMVAVANRANATVESLPTTTANAMRLAPPRSFVSAPASYVSAGASGLMFWH